MYCGDETGAYIGDVASHSSRFGYGGEDNPKMVVPSQVGGPKSHLIPSCYNLHDDTAPIFRMAKDTGEDGPNVDPMHYLQQGDLVDDWDAYELMWNASFDALRVRDRFKHTKGGGAPRKQKNDHDAGNTSTSETLRASQPSEERMMHPLLAVTPGLTHIMGTAYDRAVHRQQLQALTERMMESLDAQALFVAPSPMLAAFAHGRQTCVVVDIGAGGTRVTPVVDGHLLHHAQRRSGRGGDWLGNVSWKAMLEDDIALVPRYRVRQPAVSKSRAFHQWAMRDLQYEFRTMCDHVTLAAYRTDAYTTPFLYAEDAMDETEAAGNGHTYELPDGTLVDLSTRIGKDLCRLPELFFTEDVPMVEEEASLLDQHPTLSNAPLHKLVHASLTAVGDVDARKELVGNLVLTGSSSLFPNVEQRLSYELGGLVTGNSKARILASRNSVERTCSAWIGASVLTSLGSFQQLWLSKREYDEYGAILATQRFP
jgi:actin-related protein